MLIETAAATSRNRVIGMPVNAENLQECTAQILSWAKAAESRYVCVANVHMAVETNRDAGFREILDESDLATSDGMPLVWMLRRLGVPGKQRVCGRDLMHASMAAAQEQGVAVGFLGGAPETLATLAEKVRAQYPRLNVSFIESPPFRPATPEEERERVKALSDAQVRILFVGLGCPRQERWMSAHRGSVNAVMLGVGAAFDFLAESKPTAPKFMQNLGLEWLHRLASEPGRLWKRYLFTNSQFVRLAAQQLVQHRFQRRSARS
jgi:N-acetylglucosaminyldiphosphoundecaprenol N-acetyl-beta-D-mannosaminyltransferase